MEKHRFRLEREFALVVGPALAVLGGVAIWRGRWPTVGRGLVVAGLVVLALGFVAPRLLRYPRRGWMALAEALSFVSTRIILGVVFFLVVTPIGVFKRLQGHDPLARRMRTTGGRAQWIAYSGRLRDPRHFERQF